MDKTGIFEKSILVVAHPDDEVLWFSSLLEHMNETVICFSEVASRPDWSEGRRNSLTSYPLPNVTTLGLKESETFDGADWSSPVYTDYGLEVAKAEHTSPGFSQSAYKNNYQLLKEALSPKLKKYNNVITHNPWGEYGHEEHVQVYRVVHELQGEHGFKLWFSNYCSNKSHNLMLRYLSGFRSDYITLDTRRDLAELIERHYRKNNCWTWPFDDYSWFTHDCFIEDKKFPQHESKPGHIFPLNYIKIDHLHANANEPKVMSLNEKIKKIARKLVFSPK
jgi:LmbE family N-acetylglucosaminyl deacetylase